MAFPASTQLLSFVLENARTKANSVRQESILIRDRSAAGNVNRVDVVHYMGRLTNALAAWNAARSTPGIGPYAQEQLGSPTLDVDTEFGEMLSTATTLRDWIFANFPKDVSGAWLVHSYDASGVQSHLVFTTAQLAQFRTNVDALIARIS